MTHGDKFRASVQKGLAAKAANDTKERARREQQAVDNLDWELSESALCLWKNLEEMGKAAEHNSGKYKNALTQQVETSREMTTDEVRMLPGYEELYEACKMTNVLIAKIDIDMTPGDECGDGVNYVQVIIDPTQPFNGQDASLHPIDATAPKAPVAVLKP